MTWLPSIDYILIQFEETIGTKHVLMNRPGLMGTLDKARWGIPYQGTPSVWEQATILFKEIVENHYFMDGNKRIGVVVAYLFLEKNHFQFTPPVGEIFSMTMDVAQGKKSSSQIQAWFQEYSKNL